MADKDKESYEDQRKPVKAVLIPLYKTLADAILSAHQMPPRAILGLPFPSGDMFGDCHPRFRWTALLCFPSERRGCCKAPTAYNKTLSITLSRLFTYAFFLHVKLEGESVSNEEVNAYRDSHCDSHCNDLVSV
jgi:hypothetical protein